MSKLKKDSMQKRPVRDEDSVERQTAIISLREMVKGESNLHVRTDDIFLLRYLRLSEFDAEKAFTKMKAFYHLKMTNTGWFAQMPVDDYKELLAKHTHVVLPGRDCKNRRVYVVKMGNMDPNNCSPETMSQIDDLWLEAFADEPETQKNGVAIILDMAGYSWGMLRWLTPKNVRVGALKAESVPLKIEHHVVNTSVVMNAAVAIIFPFLSKTMKESVYFHSQDWTSLHKHINAEILPAEYGGSKPDIDYEQQHQSMLLNQKDRIWEAFQLGYKGEK